MKTSSSVAAKILAPGVTGLRGRCGTRAGFDPWGLAGAILLALSVVQPVQALPETHAQVYFRRTIDDPFVDPGYREEQVGTSQASLDRVIEGSTARFEGDAAGGTLKAYANARHYVGDDGSASGQEAWAWGWVNDQFTLDGGTAGTPLHITVTYTIDGVLSVGGGDRETLASQSNAAVLTKFVAGSGNLEHQQWALTEAEMGACWQSGCAPSAVPIHWVDQIEMDVWSEQPFDIYYALRVQGGWAYGGSAGTADFGSTGALSFSLPAGTSLTSLGGFSQTSSNGVPEPSALLLLAVGLFGLVQSNKARR